MSRRRSGYTTTVVIDTERFCITANQRDGGSLGEVFIHWGKHGSSGAGLVSVYTLTERVRQASAWIAAQEPRAGHAGYRCRTHTFGSP